VAARADDLPGYLARVRERVDRELGRILATGDGTPDPGRLREAMRYAVLGGGKRIRPAVVVAAAEAARGTLERALPAACAVELLHAYTLVHDDLPAMDDDEERRGQPTVHVAFGEWTAILVGDALLTEAFGCLAGMGAAAPEALRVLARRAGVRELLAGQARDLAGMTRNASFETLEQIHAQKTGALFAAAAELGALSAGADAQTRGRMAGFGMAIGIAFQHADDLADAEHMDFAESARGRVYELVTEAKSACAPYAGTMLPLLADWVQSLTE
jgi:geranylgeranyl pyrophosphate synthase